MSKQKQTKTIKYAGSKTKKPKIKSKPKTKAKSKVNSKTSFLVFVTHFFDNFNRNSKKYLNDLTAQTYFRILGINPNKLVDNISNEFYLESKNAVNIFMMNPTITKEFYRYIISNVSKLAFLTKFSEEQIKYVTSLETSDSKLIACAGSGKTRSIIGRIKFMVEHDLAKKEEVFAITFSKHAATDFHQKIKVLFPDYADFCILQNFSTIDSLAKSILCRLKSHKSENVEILSIAFRNYLKEMPAMDYQNITKIKNIKHLFIDEAQDLNEVQYDTAILLKEKFGTQIHLIGDPNQNIFQFRRSSSSYLINFPGNFFELTLNFRSSQEIINFAESIKPIQTSMSKSATNKHGPLVTIITKAATDIHGLILRFIKKYTKEKDLSNVAIICPTRGIGTYDSVGLSVFFNFLKLNNIPFNQLYDESGSNHGKKKTVGKTAGHINLITYHGTKGLEFDVVFVMDFYYLLFNIQPTEEEHKINQYLLYVATSRAISLMFICTYTNTHNGYLNHWITKIPSNYYLTHSPLKIPKLAFRSEGHKVFINGITDLINEMSDEHLDMVHDILKTNETDKLFTRRIYQDFTHIDRGKDEVLFGIFVEELFYLQHHLARKINPRPFSLIQLMVDSKYIIINDDSDYKLLKTYIVKNKLTWKFFDQQRSAIPDHICELIVKHFNRDTELSECVICKNEFVKIIELNTVDINTTYQKYLNPASYNHNYKKILVDFFYLVVVMYAYDINHYYYICNHGKEKQELLDNGSELFEAINNYVSYNYLAHDLKIKINVNYPKLMLLGEIDFMEKCRDKDTSENIIEIKCVKEISIKYYIQLMLYNFCYYYKKDKSKLFSNKFKIINLLTGLEHFLVMEISPANMFNLLIILAEIGGLTFNDLNLVFDLETADAIATVGPFDRKPINIPRSNIMKKGNKFIGKIYPEITEITIKDYDTGMTLIDTLVKPKGPIKLVVQKLTGITPSMLIGKPDINKVRTILKHKMKNFSNCKMLAHNGTCFDNPIVLYDKLVDPQKVSFLDTLSIIPIHLPCGIKLDSKSLGNIYMKLFGTKFNAHRAASDVDALIKIMRFLKIEF